MESSVSHGWMMRLCSAMVLLSGTVVVANQVAPARAEAAPSSASVFTAMAPQRLVDTRIGLGAPQQRLQAATSMDVQVTGQLGIPADAVAVVANVTAVDAAGPGYLQVFPTGRAEPGSSSTINVDEAGQIIPNAAFAPLGDGGKLTIYSIFDTDVVIDVSGYFTPASSSAAGRLVPLTPERVLDTRIGLGWTPPSTAGRVRTQTVDAATTITLQVAGRGGVPIDGVSAVVMNVAAVDPLGSGFVQVAPTPVVPGASSNLNTTAGRTIANLVVVPLSPAGTVDLYLTTPSDLIADVTGYFTDASAPNNGVGLFVPISPDRRLDTRAAPSGSVRPGGSVTQIDVGGISSTAIAIAGNLTATEGTQPGYLQLAATPVSPGTSSSLNVAYPGQIIASAVVSPVAAGKADLFNQNPTHEILDVTGWFTSNLSESGPPVPTDPPPVHSGDGRIAFVRDGHIFTIGYDGADELQLTSVGADSTPRWSPDGRQLVFVREAAPSTHEIWMMNADGSDQHLVAETGWFAGGAAWSPDGQRLAFQPATGPAVIMTVSTGALEPLSGAEAPEDDPEDVVFAGTPVWSPAGDAIAFVSPHAVYDSVVYDFDLATHLLRIVRYFYHGGCSSVHTFGDPSISPDSSRIGFAFVDTSPGVPTCPAPSRLVVDAYHGLASQTFATEDGDEGLDFSPSGTRTVIANSVSGTAQLVVADATGGDRTSLVDGAQPDWQPID